MNIKNNQESGFTLIELVFAMIIIGILATVAMPQYRKYQYEAQATQLLIDIYAITLAYKTSIMTDEIRDAHNMSNAELNSYRSHVFGKAPPAYSSLKNAYKPANGLLLSSDLVNHGGFFKNITDSIFPVIFVYAPDEQSQKVLFALDHLTKNEHVLLNDKTMLIALLSPNTQENSTIVSVDTNSPGTTSTGTGTTGTATGTTSTGTGTTGTAAGTTSTGTGTGTTGTATGATSTGTGTTVTATGTTSTGTGTGTTGTATGATSTGTGTTVTATGTTSTGTGTTGTATGTTSTGTGSTGTGITTDTYHEQAGTACTWPPGWCKHPHQHHGHN